MKLNKQLIKSTIIGVKVKIALVRKLHHKAIITCLQGYNIDKRAAWLRLGFSYALESENQELCLKMLKRLQAEFPNSLASKSAAVFYSYNYKEENLFDSLTELLSSDCKLGDKTRIALKHSDRLPLDLQRQVLLGTLLQNPKSIGANMKLGDIFFNNGDYHRAINHYSAAKTLGSKTADMKLLPCYHATKDDVKAVALIINLTLRWNRLNLMKTHNLLSRFVPFYPSTSRQFFKRKKELIGSHHKTLSQKDLIDLRYVSGYEDTSDKWLSKFIEFGKKWQPLFEAAYQNDGATERLACISNGKTRLLKDTDHGVELFIPTFFFNHKTPNKSIYDTLRKGYGHIIDHVLNSNLTVVPRFQYQWRHADLLTTLKPICFHSVIDRKGIVVQESTLSGRVNIDTQGYAGFSEWARTPIPTDPITDEKLIDVNKFIKTFNISRNSKYPQLERDMPTMRNRYIFFPLQVTTDSVNALRNLSTETAIKIAIDFCREHNIDLVVKRHPECKSSNIDKLLRVLDHEVDVHISTSNVKDLIERSIFTVCANSGVGLEALLRGKKVITYGISDYSKATENAATGEELFELLNNSIKNPKLDIPAAFIYDYITVFSHCIHDRNGLTTRLNNLLH
ncbi:hypothetical protein [Vibrio barjaei]|uniref:capsular polysaccharide export protein, LipB/KpsS family n=1 Tax=Vibrio barjaei TaxID=1676683 RepID=UPI002284AAA0|nr:hypothetical protein [Vibrio barjaei]MCY9872349.1 hypothetical protein [Vibrio barjaei]